MYKMDNLSEIGKGTHSTVYYSKNSNTAIKVQKNRLTEPEYIRELLILNHLSGKPGINQMKGYSLEKYEIHLERYPSDLRTILQNNSILHLPEIIKITIGILSGVLSSNSSGVFHCDIKPANILVDGEFNAVLCDWGSSVFFISNDRPLTTEVYSPELCTPLGGFGSSRHNRDERFYQNIVKWDPFSVGLVIMEMILHTRVFKYKCTTIEEMKSQLDMAYDIISANLADRHRRARESPKSSEWLLVLCKNFTDVNAVNRWNILDAVMFVSEHTNFQFLNAELPSYNSYIFKDLSPVDIPEKILGSELSLTTRKWTKWLLDMHPNINKDSMCLFVYNLSEYYVIRDGELLNGIEGGEIISIDSNEMFNITKILIGKVYNIF